MGVLWLDYYSSRSLGLRLELERCSFRQNQAEQWPYLVVSSPSVYVGMMTVILKLNDADKDNQFRHKRHH